MKNAKKKSWRAGAEGFVMYLLLLLTAVLFLQTSFAQGDLVSASRDTSSHTYFYADTAFIAEMDTASFKSEPVKTVMGVPATTFWTYIAMGFGLIIVICLAYFTSVSKDKKTPTKKN